MFFFICSVPFKFAAASLFFLQFFLFAAFAFYFVCSASFLFAAFIFCLQRIFFICSVRFLFAAFVFLFAAHLFCLQRSFFVCSVRFLFAAHLFCLQRFSLLAACPLWAIVEMWLRLDSDDGFSSVQPNNLKRLANGSIKNCQLNGIAQRFFPSKLGGDLDNEASIKVCQTY